MGSIKKEILMISLVFVHQAVVSCGLTESRFLFYPKPQKKAAHVEATCPIGLAAFTYHVVPLIQKNCMNGCHMAGGNAGHTLAFGGDAESDRRTLKTKEGGTALGLFRKAKGLTPHSGGAAAQDSDMGRFERWFAAEALCTLPPEEKPLPKQ